MLGKSQAGRPASSGEEATRKISTPAGEKLTTILESSNRDHKLWNNNVSRQSLGIGNSGLPIRPPGTAPLESEQSYTTIWSDAGLLAKESEEEPPPERPKFLQYLDRRGGWRRLLIFAVILTLVIIGLVVGLVLGLKQEKKSAPPNPILQPAQASSPVSTTSINDATATPTALAKAAATPSAFPVGEYSIMAFYDSSSANCTGNSNTWTCPPYTTYSESEAASLVNFNWNITAGGSSDTYRVSSIDNPFQTSFTNVELSLENAGRDDEHYTLQFLYDKQVRPSQSLTTDGNAALCFFNSTTFQAYLYTKKAQTYAASASAAVNAPYTHWPFAVRVQSAVSGGMNVPNCYELNNNRLGARVNSTTLEPQPQEEICDCLYLNYAHS